MKRIAVLTSGGDAPGMNAAIRAIVRTGLDKGWEVFGIHHGYAGLIAGDFASLSARDVGGIIQQGGTTLGSARSSEFRTEGGRSKALRHLSGKGIDALIVIGGNGSQAGAYFLSQMNFPVIGVASTIDNDLFGSEISIGVDTALNIALEAIDRLKTTASSHRRVFVVEVMGRECGYLSLMAAIAGGAEAVVIPEIEPNLDTVAQELEDAYVRGKAHAIVVVAEGAKYNAATLVQHLKEYKKDIGFDLRTTILGHVQRGGAPSAFDRLLGTRLGIAAVDILAKGKLNLLVGLLNGENRSTPLSEVTSKQKMLDLNLLKLAKVLAR